MERSSLTSAELSTGSDRRLLKGAKNETGSRSKKAAPEEEEEEESNIYYKDPDAYDIKSLRHLLFSAMGEQQHPHSPAPTISSLGSLSAREGSLMSDNLVTYGRPDFVDVTSIWKILDRSMKCLIAEREERMVRYTRDSNTLTQGMHLLGTLNPLNEDFVYEIVAVMNHYLKKRDTNSLHDSEIVGRMFDLIVEYTKEESAKYVRASISWQDNQFANGLRSNNIYN